MWIILLLVALAGAIGGLVDSLLAGEVPLPRIVDVDGTTVVLPGLLGNLVVGAIAAVISYGLYGPLASASVLRRRQDNGHAPAIQLTLASFVGAVLVGYSGGRWISAEAEQRLNHATAVRAAEQLQAVRDVPVGVTAGPDAMTAERARRTGRTLLNSLRTGDAYQAYRSAVASIRGDEPQDERGDP